MLKLVIAAIIACTQCSIASSEFIEDNQYVQSASDIPGLSPDALVSVDEEYKVYNVTTDSATGEYKVWRQVKIVGYKLRPFKLRVEMVSRVTQHTLFAVAQPGQEYFDETQCGAIGFEVGKSASIGNQQVTSDGDVAQQDE